MTWLASLPAAAVYAVLAMLAFAENIVPIVPADVAAALGAFLARRGTTSPAGVFLAVWLSNVTGAVAVYLSARRLGRPFLSTALGRRLLSPQAVAQIERGYLRYGVLGIFFSRFLPGIRAVVPPFAGIFGLGGWRAIPPLAAASAIWYGGITALGFFLGGEWRAIVEALGQLSRVLAFGSVLVLLAGATVLYLRRERPDASLLAELRRLLEREEEAPQAIAPRDAARLVLEVAYAEEGLSEEQRAAVAAHLRERWGLEVPIAGERPRPAGRLARIGRALGQRFSSGRRLALVEEMWHAAFAEGRLAAEEEWLMRRAGELLALAPTEVEALRSRLRAGKK